MNVTKRTVGELMDGYTIAALRQKAADTPINRERVASFEMALDMYGVCPGRIPKELKLLNKSIWQLIDKVMANEHTRDDARTIQQLNAKRNAQIRAIDALYNQADIGEKVYA